MRALFMALSSASLIAAGTYTGLAQPSGSQEAPSDQPDAPALTAFADDASPDAAPPAGPKERPARPPRVHVLPPHAMDVLDLTDDQERQIQELEREARGKLAKILTPEQQKQLQEMRPPGPPPPHGSPAGRPGMGDHRPSPRGDDGRGEFRRGDGPSPHFDRPPPHARGHEGDDRSPPHGMRRPPRRDDRDDDRGPPPGRRPPPRGDRDYDDDDDDERGPPPRRFRRED